VTIWRMHIACWIPKATNTHTGCVILIDFPLQRWLHESAAALRYTYIVCLVLSRFPIVLKRQLTWESIKEARNISTSRSRIKIIPNTNQLKSCKDYKYISALEPVVLQRYYIQHAPRCLCSTKLPRLLLHLAGGSLQPFNTRRFSTARSKCNCLIR
jgi:hypothetical protein